MSNTTTPAPAATTEEQIAQLRESVNQIAEAVATQNKSKGFSLKLKWGVAAGLVLAVFLALWVFRPTSTPTATAPVAATPENEELKALRVELETAKVEREVAAKAAAEQEEAQKKAQESDALRKEMSSMREDFMAAIAAASASSKATVSAATSSTPVQLEASTNNGSSIAAQINEGLRLQYGVAHAHTGESTPPPGLTWLDLGGVQIPIFRNPRMNNQWAFVTGDLLDGVKTPPRSNEVPLPEGRTWIPLTAANIPPTGAINPDGQNMSIDRALMDGALIYGTVAVR